MGQTSSSKNVSKKSSKTNLNSVIISAFGDLAKGQDKIDYESFKVFFYF